MENKYVNQNVDRLDVYCRIIDILKDNKIKKLSQLAKKSKRDLRELGLENQEINKIDIELQLLGLSLKGSL